MHLSSYVLSFYPPPLPYVSLALVAREHFGEKYKLKSVLVFVGNDCLCSRSSIIVTRPAHD